MTAPHRATCDCGQAATTRSSSEWVCERCARAEGSYHTYTPAERKSVVTASAIRYRKRRQVIEPYHVAGGIKS